MNIYKYNYKISKNDYGLNINIKNSLDLIKYLIDFSILFLSIEPEEVVYKKIDELKFENIYLIKEANKYYILALFNTKYFIISTPLQFNIDNNNMFFYGKEIKIIDLEIFKYLIKMLEEENDIVYNLNEAINNFKSINENINYNMEEKDLVYIFMKLLNYPFYYARYDYDKKNEKGHLHPLNHIDFSIENRLKLGLYNKITPCDFINLNLHKDIYYIKRNNNKANTFYNSISRLFK